MGEEVQERVSPGPSSHLADISLWELKTACRVTVSSLNVVWSPACLKM